MESVIDQNIRNDNAEKSEKSLVNISYDEIHFIDKSVGICLVGNEQQIKDGVQ